jgi:hypothetical protein
MFMNIFHVRAVMALAGVVVLVGYLAMGGSFGSKSTVLIEFGMYSQEFEGRDVEIDGKIVGQLKMFGAATRSAFAVKDGKHIVRVIHPEFECEPRTITSGVGGSDVMLILDFLGERDGQPVIGFQ